MRKLNAFMHVSLDGLVAGPNGEMNWITVNEEIFDYVGDRTNKADTALYGRKTYDMMESYWPTAGDKPSASKHDIEHSKWYNNVNKVVLSKTMKGTDLPGTKIISDNLAAEINGIKELPGKDIILFGSPSAVHSLLHENLIDGFWLFINPILLGQGISLFKNIQEKVKLRLTDSHTFSSGVICLNYEKV